MAKGNDMMNGKCEGDECCEERAPASEFYPKGATPALTKDYSKASDADLTNGFTPQVRKN